MKSKTHKLFLRNRVGLPLCMQKEIATILKLSNLWKNVTCKKCRKDGER